jgi:hypothetical protein
MLPGDSLHFDGDFVLRALEPVSRFSKAKLPVVRIALADVLKLTGRWPGSDSIAAATTTLRKVRTTNAVRAELR